MTHFKSFYIPDENCYAILEGITAGFTFFPSFLALVRTLAARGLEEFFSSCAVVSVFLLWPEIGFGITYVHRVQ